MNSASTIELIDKVIEGDKIAYSSLFYGHYNYCFAKALKIIGDSDVAKDLVQESFIEAYFCIGNLKDKSAFKPWLGGIVKNVCKNYLRIHSRQFKSLKQYVECQHDIEAQEDGKIIEIITQAIGTLSKPSGDIIFAFYYDGKSILDISSEFGITPALTKVSIHRARKELKAIIEKTSGVEYYKTYHKNKKAMKQVKIIDLIPSSNDLKAWIIALHEEELNLVLPIVITTELAAAMAAGIKGIVLSRPLTHHLLAEVLSTNGIQPESACITNIENGIYHSVLKVKGQHGLQEYDARPSDAINIAIRFGCPIFVSQAVIKKAGIQIPEKFSNQPPLEKGITQLIQYIENEQLKVQERFNLAKNNSADNMPEQAEKLMSFVFEG